MVDDSADEREVLNDLLAMISGCRCVLEAGDAKSALLGILKARPDIVLLDLRLPGMSGLDCARRLKTVAPTLKIIAITGFADEASVNDALNLGVCGFLTKPISRRALADALKVAVDGGIYLSSALRPFFHEATPAEPRVAPDPASVLTPREREVVALLASGLGYKEIAERLKISPYTVNNHLAHVREKLGVHSAIEAINKLFLRPE